MHEDIEDEPHDVITVSRADIGPAWADASDAQVCDNARMHFFAALLVLFPGIDPRSASVRSMQAEISIVEGPAAKDPDAVTVATPQELFAALDEGQRAYFLLNPAEDEPCLN